MTRTRSQRVLMRARTTPRDTAAIFGTPRIVLQPIVSVATGSVLAVESLARFDAVEGANTEAIFETAHATGHGVALETASLTAALRLRDTLPESMLLTVNVSPDVLPHLERAEFWPDDLAGVIVEITEQDAEHPSELAEYMDALRARGAAIAIDDVSTGYAGLLRLAQLRPDYVKVDRQVVAGVGESFTQAAVLEALVTFSHRIGAAVIGEGVEELADLAALGQFDVDYAQGYAIARPASAVTPIPAEVVAACRTGRRELLRGASSVRHAASTRDVYSVTATLASAAHRNDITAAIAATAADLGVDVIGVSIVGSGLNLHEIAITGDTLDTNIYPLVDYPVTLSVIEGAGTIEIQASDPDADPSEIAVLHSLGHASLLLVPVYQGPRVIGVLEFAHRTPRRWSVHDIVHAQGLAAHLAPVLIRLGVTAAPARAVGSRVG